MNRQILRLALPAVVSNITVPLLGIVDLAIVGHLGSERYIAAIAVGAMVFNVIYWLMAFLRMGTSGLTAQALGRGDDEAVRANYSLSLVLALTIGLAFVVLQRPLRWLALLLMQVEGVQRELVAIYFDICIIGAPAMLGVYALTGWFIGMQNTRVPMVVAIVQNVVNIVLSLVFTMGFGMKIEGVALGTMLAQWVAFGTLLFTSLARNKGGAVFSRLKKGKEAELVGAYFSVNRDIFLRTLCLVSVNLFFTSAGSAQGTMIVAVNTLLMTLFTLFSYVMDGLAYAGEAMGGKLYGAGEWAKLHLLTRRLLMWGTVMAVAFTVVYAVGGAPFLGLLTDDAVVVRSAMHYLPYVLLVPAVSFCAFVYDGLFIGMTMSRQMLLCCFVAAVAFFGVYFALFPSLHNIALWMAYLTFLLVRSVVGAVQSPSVKSKSGNLNLNV